MSLKKTVEKKDFWKNLKEYYNDPAVLKAKANEFADGVTDEFNPDTLNTVSRRRFIALLSASAAFAATACSDYQDKGEIIPYTKRPEGVLPGKPNFYATIVNGKSVLVRVREGRPINIEGNPDHPIYMGKIDAQSPAVLLNLYDPERLKEPYKKKRKIDWEKADSEILDLLGEAVVKNKEIAIITDRIASPATLKLINNFKEKFPTTKWYSYQSSGDENKRIAWQSSYGSRNVPSIKLDKAQIILSLESDFLGREGNTIENTRLFTQRKDVMNSNNFNRLYSVEGAMSLTGINSDYRIRLRADAQLEFVLSLLNEIVLKKNVQQITLTASIKSLISKYQLKNFINKYKLDSIKINYLVDDLVKYQGQSIVLAGEILPVDVHSAVIMLNEVLGNSALYDYNSVNLDFHPMSTSDELKGLVSSASKGNIGVLINFGINPIFNMPKELGLEEAFQKIPNTISIVESENETSDKSTYTLAASNELESWGDNYVRSDIYELQQPLIAPIFNTRQKENILLTWINGSAEAYSMDAIHHFVMENFKDIYNLQNSPVDFKSYWYNALHDGFVKVIPSAQIKYSFNQSSFDKISSTETTSEYLVQLQKSYFIGDGKFANNGWLQEIPHPVSKVAWDNYAALSPNSAKELGVENNDYVKVVVNGKFLEIPVMLQPGMADKLLSIELGYGRTVIGDAGKNSGFNAVVLMSGTEVSNYLLTNAAVTKPGGSYKLVSTQEHHPLDDNSVKDFHKIRKIIQEGTVEEYKKNSKFLHEDEHNLIGITREHKYEGVKWGMSIDLNKCTSCASCVTSCNVENNIPVVGKDQVANGREMHWIRIDRYYSGTPDDPEVSGQPMLCQHCDNAPCENVCPVNATNHSPDGLNQMAYNRCVGTRYCANNCPYKVRRFNFYNFRDHFADAYYENELTSLVNNPEVTVRSRGVMEKCTFCVQRIMEARETAIAEGRELKGSDVKTACQSACPADAIVFGDTNDKESKISKYREHELGYHVLEELYVKPNVTYLAKLRNTHSEEA
ncbi:MAG: molybdopterin oxidoreductase [Ignavibacteriae bacterium HGW-Ignavibacteriae-2]|jgi:molybdopterin-containing oxidoreductase family iron-sulfur binding subunit|nr:MAG: molybdopterin oxidoreductase [Ignavibacteriae bacterium HGW-Ignavibacteriae-2]